MNSAQDLLDNNITLFYDAELNPENIMQQFEDSPNPIYQELSKLMMVTHYYWTSYDKYLELVNRTVLDGSIVEIDTGEWKQDYNYHYLEEEVELGSAPETSHLLNKKWPLKEVTFTWEWFHHSKISRVLRSCSSQAFSCEEAALKLQISLCVCMCLCVTKLTFNL